MKNFSVCFGALALAATLLLIGCGGDGDASGLPTSGGTTSNPPPPPAGSSAANAVNDSNFVVGNGTNATNQHACLFLIPGNKAPASYTVTTIGTFGGGTQVAGINVHGDATGWSITPGGAAHAYLFKGSTSTLVDLGSLAGDNTSEGNALTDDDQVVGYSALVNAADAAQPTTEGFHWDSVNGMQKVADPLGTTFASLNCINSSGLMGGTYDQDPGFSSQFGYLSTLAGPPKDLSVATNSGLPRSVNAGGSMVGGTNRAWTYNTASQTYALLAPQSAVGAADAVAINTSGVIVGSDLMGTATDAVMWKAGAENNLGVRGQATVVDLNDLIPAGSLPGSDYLKDATGINASGQICCNTEGFRAVILTPVVAGAAKPSGRRRD